MRYRDLDGSDFRALYDEVFPIVYRIAFRVTEDVLVSEELCHEAFVRYVERDGSFPDANQAKYWLIRVTKNLALNYQKRRGRERRAYQRAYYEPSHPSESGETAILKSETSAMVRAAVEKLPEKLKSVLVLKEYGELSYRDIAETLGITEANVKVRVFRARERLTTLLKESDVYVP